MSLLKGYCALHFFAKDLKGCSFIKPLIETDRLFIESLLISKLRVLFQGAINSSSCLRSDSTNRHKIERNLEKVLQGKNTAGHDIKKIGNGLEKLQSDKDFAICRFTEWIQFDLPFAVAQVDFNAAHILFNRGQYDLCEGLCRKQLSILGQIQKTRHTIIYRSRAFYFIAGCKYRNQEYTKAFELYEEELKLLLERDFGGDQDHAVHDNLDNQNACREMLVRPESKPRKFCF